MKEQSSDRHTVDPDAIGADVTRTWREHWQQSPLRQRGTLGNTLVNRYAALSRGMSGARLMTNVIEKHAAPLAGKRALEPGVGTGWIAVNLANRGAIITALDVSDDALAIARRSFVEARQQATFVPGTVFDLPFTDGSFDLVYNTGLLEHFERPVRAQALAEMLRVLSAQGVCVTINPNARAKMYRRLKAAAERRGTWDVGYEEPLYTLGDVLDHKRYVLEEYSVGWLMQLHFVKYVLPHPLRLPYIALHELVQTALWFLNRRPGYGLVSVIRPR